MNVSISGHHISVTEAMDTAVREKLRKSRATLRSDTEYSGDIITR